MTVNRVAICVSVKVDRRVKAEGGLCFAGWRPVGRARSRSMLEEPVLRQVKFREVTEDQNRKTGQRKSEGKTQKAKEDEQKVK